MVNDTLFYTKILWFIYPILDQAAKKPLPFPAAHIYIAYIQEYTPRGSVNVGSHFALRVFLHVVQFSSLMKNQHFQIPAGPG